MGDRRRYQRFVLGDGCEGTFRSLEDVSVEKVTDDELLLSTVAPARPGETVTVEIPGGEGQEDSVFTGEVTECKPVMTDGTLRHRVVVKVKDTTTNTVAGGQSGE